MAGAVPVTGVILAGFSSKLSSSMEFPVQPTFENTPNQGRGTMISLIKSLFGTVISGLSKFNVCTVSERGIVPGFDAGDFLIISLRQA